jgi:hypothetical protein
LLLVCGPGGDFGRRAGRAGVLLHPRQDVTVALAGGQLLFERLRVQSRESEKLLVQGGRRSCTRRSGRPAGRGPCPTCAAGSRSRPAARAGCAADVLSSPVRSGSWFSVSCAFPGGCCQAGIAAPILHTNASLASIAFWRAGKKLAGARTG